MTILQSESFKKGIALSTLFNFGAKGLSFLSNIVIAYYFGTQTGTDIYIFSIGIILFVSSLINGFSTSVLIPESMRIKEEKGIKASQQFLNSFFYLFIIISIFLVIISIISPAFVFSIFSKYPLSLLREYQIILVLAILMLPLTCINSFLLEIFASYKFFTLPMIFSVLTSMLSILSIILLHDMVKTASILIGLLAANSANVLYMIFLLKRKLSWPYSYSRSEISSRTIKNIIYSEAGNISTAAAGYIPLYVISGFNAGLITAMNYGRQVADLLNILFTNQICSVAGIKLNGLYVKKQFDEFNSTYIRTSELISFLLVPLSLIIALYSQEILTIIYKRGAFNHSSVLQSSLFLRYFVLSVCLVGIDLIAARAILATQKIKHSFWYQIGMNCIQIISIFVLLPKFKELAIPLSIFIKYFINLFTLWFFFKYNISVINYSRIILNLLKLLFINILIALSLFIILKPIFIHNRILVLFLTMFLHFFILFTLSIVFKINSELNSFLLGVGNFIRYFRNSLYANKSTKF